MGWLHAAGLFSGMSRFSSAMCLSSACMALHVTRRGMRMRGPLLCFPLHAAPCSPMHEHAGGTIAEATTIYAPSYSSPHRMHAHAAPGMRMREALKQRPLLYTPPHTTLCVLMLCIIYIYIYWCRCSSSACMGWLLGRRPTVCCWQVCGLILE
jgi:hypothetical protein